MDLLTFYSHEKSNILTRHNNIYYKFQQCVITYLLKSNYDVNVKFMKN